MPRPTAPEIRRALAGAALPLLAVPLLAVTVAQPWKVEGRSMEPSVDDGSLLLVDGLLPRLLGYGRGDIVVVPLPGDDPSPYQTLVKRIVALPGEHVHIEEGAFEVNGRPLDEPYLAPGTHIVTRADETLDLVVPDGAVYVLGDRRENSYDSKAFGAVPLDSLRGRVWVALGPHDIRVQVPVIAGPEPGG